MNKILFLDRDGIINVDHGYVHKINDFEFIKGIFDVCLHAIKRGYKIIVITNQSGIGRGYYTVDDFDKLTKWMKEQFLKNEIHITDVYYCPHHPDKGINEFKIDCLCRKPEPGMLLAAKAKYSVDMANSVFIGDKLSDMQAAESAGIQNKILFSEKLTKTDYNIKNIQLITDINGAIQFIN